MTLIGPSLALEAKIRRLVASNGSIPGELLTDFKSRGEIVRLLAELTKQFEDFDYIAAVDGAVVGVFAGHLADTLRKPLILVRRGERSEPFSSSVALNGKKILLLDDVLLSGDTMSFAASRIRNEGKGKLVGALVIENNDMTSKKRRNLGFAVGCVFKRSDFAYARLHPSKRVTLPALIEWASYT